MTIKKNGNKGKLEWENKKPRKNEGMGRRGEEEMDLGRRSNTRKKRSELRRIFGVGN